LNRPGGNAAPLQGLPYRQHQVQSGVSWDVRRGMYFDSNLYVYSGLSAQNIGPRARLDARFARRLGEGAEWSIGIQDALNDHAPEYVPDDYVSGSNPARSVYTKITWGR
jgi:hypothetical protein